MGGQIRTMDRSHRSWHESKKTSRVPGCHCHSAGHAHSKRHSNRNSSEQHGRIVIPRIKRRVPSIDTLGRESRRLGQQCRKRHLDVVKVAISIVERCIRHFRPNVVGMNARHMITGFNIPELDEKRHDADAFVAGEDQLGVDHAVGSGKSQSSGPAKKGGGRRTRSVAREC